KSIWFLRGSLMICHWLQAFTIVLLLILPSFSSGQDAWFGDLDSLWATDGVEILPVTNLPGQVRSVCRDASGGGWIALESSNQIVHVDVSGNISETVETSFGVQSLAVARDGRIWATRPGLDDVIVIQPGQGIVASYSVGVVPYGICIDAQDRVWVSCSYSNNIHQLSSTGQLIQVIPTGFFPTGITTAHDGGVWLAEKDGMRKISATGDLLWSGVAGNFPISVTTDLQGRAWFACKLSHQVAVVGDSGLENLIDVPALPIGISGNGDGGVTVVCGGGSAVIRISSSGEIVDQDWVADPGASGDLTGLVRALTVDPQGDVDMDGVPNLREAQLGFDPFDPNSSPMYFIRGDANQDGNVNLSDAITTLMVLFGIESSSCLESLDIDDDAQLTLADPLRILDHLFGNGPPPGAPFPDLGPDPDPAQGLPCSP
ncbi:MAG: hypothetical protein AAEJ04_11065, partial [Planctomycetota bacterium]